MAATISSASYVPAPVNFVLMKGLLSAARKKLPYFNGTLPGTLEQNGGSLSVKWERINNLAAVTTALGETTGTAAAFLGRNSVTPTVSNVTATLAKYGNWIIPSEEIDLTNVNTRAAKFLDTLGANAGESLNVLLKNVYDTATLVRYANNVVAGAANTSNVAYSIGIGDIKYAVNQLNTNAARTFTPIGYGSTNIGTTPIRSSYYGICHVDVEEDIRSLVGFIPVEQYAGYTETMPFEFGAAGGVRFCSSQVSKISSGAGKKTATGFRGSSTTANDVYNTYIYGQEAVGTVGLGNMHASNAYEMYNPKNPPAVQIIYKGFTEGGAFNPYNEIGSLAWKAWFVGKILNATWIVNIKSLASKL